MRRIPLNRKQANAYLRKQHRHSGPVVGFKFAFGLVDGRNLMGIVIAGRPVAKAIKGETLEITRCCTAGGKNLCSMLYGAAARIARELGYERVITYTLASEPGTSLKAAGFTRVAEVDARSWDRPKRQRRDKHGIERRVRWERWLVEPIPVPSGPQQAARLFND